MRLMSGSFTHPSVDLVKGLTTLEPHESDRF